MSSLCYFLSQALSESEEKVIADFRKKISQDDVGIFIFEPLVQGAAGMRMYSEELLDNLIAIANENEVICLADEVFTGFGRTGKLFASNYLKNNPDIIAISKGITGGSMALGVTSCSSKITSAFESIENSKTLYHGHSYTANPLACAAANASFQILTSRECLRNIYRISKKMKIHESELAKHKNVKEVRSLGTILAIELMTSDSTSYTNPMRKKIYSFFLSRGILLRPLGNVMYVLPPYITSDSELDFIFTTIGEFLDTLEIEV